MRLFGWEFRRAEELDARPSFAPKESDDGAVIVAAGGSFGTYVDLDGTVRTEAELVTKYREMSLQPEINTAVDEIINESMSLDEKDIVTINLDNLKTMSPKLKDIVRAEFDNCLNILNFRHQAYEVYRRWYIDGRLYYHVIIDENAPQNGIQEIRYVDPRKIRKVREIAKRRVQGGVNSGQTDIPRTQNEYYIFNDRGFNYGNKVVGPSTAGLKIAKDAVLHVTSGLTDTQGTMVLGYLHIAIKAINQLRTLEDSLVIYRLSRAPERRIWYIDVGNLPKMKAEQYVREIMVKHKNRLIYDSECLALDTKIPLLDGRTLTLNEMIVEHDAGKQNWVYSCDPETGKFVPGPVTWAGTTRRDAQVMKITLDNGQSVTCTPDHKFPVWDRGFIEAKDLAVGESMVPNYRRTEPIVKDGNEYEQVFNNETKSWEFTHRTVAAWKNENGLREEMVHDVSFEDAVKQTIHHKDYSRTNNVPENLVMMHYVDHIKHHSANVRQMNLVHNPNIKAWSNETNDARRHTLSNSQTIEFTEDVFSLVSDCAKASRGMEDAISYVNEHVDLQAWRELNILKKTKLRDPAQLIFTYKDLLKICKNSGFKDWRAYRNSVNLVLGKYTSYQEAAEALGVHENQIAHKVMREKKIKNGTFIPRSQKLRTVHTSKSWKIKTPEGEEVLTQNLNEFCRQHVLNRTNIKCKYGSKGYRAEELYNHKIIGVEYLPNRIDTGTLTIDGEEKYHSHHTFALDAGIYTKNSGQIRDDRKFMSMLEDYWLPRREGGRGTEVTTLPGGMNLGQLEDVLYFQKKLYQCMYVPVNRLNSDALFSIGRATEVTRDEIKFSRFVARLRGKFSMLFTKMLEKQLALKQIMTVEEFAVIGPELVYDFSRDNYFTELKDAEMLMSRTNNARQMQDMVGKYFSQEWMRRNVLQQSDDDVSEMDSEIEKEFESGDVRWQNPISLQQTMLPADEGGLTPESITPEIAKTIQTQADEHDRLSRVENAKARYSLLKQKTNKSLADHAELKSVAQIASKNK